MMPYRSHCDMSTRLLVLPCSQSGSWGDPRNAKGMLTGAVTPVKPYYGPSFAKPPSCALPPLRLDSAAFALKRRVLLLKEQSIRFGECPLTIPANRTDYRSGLPASFRRAPHEWPLRADHHAAMAKFTSILRHKPRPVTKSLPPQFNKNPELISAE